MRQCLWVAWLLRENISLDELFAFNSCATCKPAMPTTTTWHLSQLLSYYHAWRPYASPIRAGSEANQVCQSTKILLAYPWAKPGTYDCVSGLDRSHLLHGPDAQVWGFQVSVASPVPCIPFPLPVRVRVRVRVCLCVCVCVRVFLRKQGKWQTVAAVLESDAALAGKIDTILCNAALDSYARGAKWLQAHFLFCKMHRVRICKPDEISSSTLLAACENASLWQPQLAILGVLAWCWYWQKHQD